MITYLRLLNESSLQNSLCLTTRLDLDQTIGSPAHRLQKLTSTVLRRSCDYSPAPYSVNQTGWVVGRLVVQETDDE